MSDKTNILGNAVGKVLAKKGSPFNTAAMLTKAMTQQGLTKQEITEAMNTGKGMAE